MASNYTEHYELCQWEATDQVQRTDFNADNAKIDAALDALAGQVAEKADGDDLAALSETVAEVSAGMGNCDMEILTYIGNGSKGPYNPTQITFTQMPDIYLAAGDMAILVGRGGQSTAVVGSKSASDSSSFFNEVNIAWNGSQMSFYNTAASRHQLNSADKPYWVLGLKRKI